MKKLSLLSPKIQLLSILLAIVLVLSVIALVKFLGEKVSQGVIQTQEIAAAAEREQADLLLQRLNDLETLKQELTAPQIELTISL